MVPLLGFAAGAFAQPFPRTLNEVKLFGAGETIQFVFSQPFEGSPEEEHRRGALALTFVGVGNRIPARELSPSSGAQFKLIRVAENPYSTTVTLLYRDANLSLKDRLHYSRAGNLLTVEVRARGSAPSAPHKAALPEENRLLAEMEQKIGGGTAAQSQPASQPQAQVTGPAAPPRSAGPVTAPAATTATPADAPKPGSPARSPVPFGGTTSPGLGTLAEGDFFTALATMVAALAFIVLGLYGVLWVYKRYFDRRLGRFTGGVAFKQVASFAVGPRHRIVILEINGETIACGVTPAQITFLTRLSEGRGSGAPPPEAGDPPQGPPESPRPGRKAGNDPVHQFAELLRRKVRSMKPIQ